MSESRDVIINKTTLKYINSYYIIEFINNYIKWEMYYTRDNTRNIQDINVQSNWYMLNIYR